MQYQVSVVIASYNSEYDKLRKVIVSVLKQRDINLEIIIADDGSKKNYFFQIEELFQKSNFKNYKLVGSEKNQGTCKNIEKVMKYVKGEYLKFLSPGDYLYEEDTLIKWYTYMKKNKLKVSFGKAIYYCLKDDKLQLVSRTANPRNPYLYDLKKYSRNAKIAYLILRDYALGAAYMVEKKIFIEYINLIVGTVKYLEDGMFRIMMLDDVPIVYYPERVIWYEYGLGVSTSKNPKWEQAMRDDSMEIIKIIEDRNCRDDFFSRKYVRYYKKTYRGKLHQEIVRSCLFPQYVFIKLRDMIKPEKTESVSNFSYIENL